MGVSVWHSNRSTLLRLYVEALTGREVDIAPLAAVPDEVRIGDGRTIQLPSLVNEFGDEDLDFRLYKVRRHTRRARSSFTRTRKYEFALPTHH